jgi:bifunctional non-homologous end joining protein LigD
VAGATPKQCVENSMADRTQRGGPERSRAGAEIEARSASGGRLERYEQKRNFAVTPEPKPTRPSNRAGRSFVIQKHWASHLHYDFRLELDGVLVSWAVPKGPSFDPKDKRLAVHVEDHPLSYGSFEGTIPPKQYGAGEVIVWDRGRWEPVDDPHDGLKRGKLAFRLHGEKLAGLWELIRTSKPGDKQERWFLFKKRDAWARPAADYDVTQALPDSVVRKPLGLREDREPTAEAAAAEPKEGRVRHAAFKGLRSDKPPTAISREKPKAPPAAQTSASTVTPHRVKITHADRVIDPSTDARKIDLVRYYESVADCILPHVEGRPVSLVRAPQGIAGPLFFQKHPEARVPGVTVLPASLWPDHDPLLSIDSVEALVSAAQMNVVELHSWNSKARTIDKPDRVVFDLDPGQGVPWSQMQEAALLTRTLLTELGLKSWLKTSGGKGLHVVVPIAPRLDAERVKGFAQAVVQHLAQTIPARFAAKSGAKNRVGKIFVDYLRNGFGATTAAAFSARARPGLGVSMPVSWDQLMDLTSGDMWTIKTARECLRLQGTDPWADYWTCRQGLARAIKAVG